MDTFFSFCLKKWDRLVLIGLLLLHVLLCAFFLRHNYLTVDEPVHITGGLEILQNMGHTVNPESGVLPQVVTALPLLARVDMPPELTMEKRLITPYPYARYVLYDVAECQESDFFFARLIMVSFSLLACTALWLIARKTGGRIPALLVAALYVFMPLFVSNAPLSTADMASSCFFLTTLLTCHLLLRRCQLQYFLLFFLSCGALLFSKMSAVSI